MFETHVLPHLQFVTGFAVFKQYFLSGNREAGGAAAIPHGWLLAVRQHVESIDSESSVGSLSRGFEAILSTTMNWANTASWDDLVNWCPPPLPLIGDTPVNPHRIGDELWIIERFTKTYLSEWSVAALRCEWLYLHGQHLSPSDPTEMRVREVSANDLAKVMADRLGAEPSPSEQIISMMLKPALKFLEDGRRTEAAALFEAALRHNPNNADALNNLSFCLIPDGPAQALRHLDAAIDTGQADIELTTADRLLVLILLGRWTSACGLATPHWNGSTGSTADGSTTTTSAASHQPKPKTSTTVNNTQATRLRLKPNSLRETR